MISHKCATLCSLMVCVTTSPWRATTLTVPTSSAAIASTAASRKKLPRARSRFATSIRSCAGFPNSRSSHRRCSALRRLRLIRAWWASILPGTYNPPSGIIATANGRITPDNYPNPISMGWGAPWRTARIYHVLESGRQFSPADMLALQTDIRSESDLFVAERLVYAVDHATKPSARARQAADLLRSWDGLMQASSPAPTITRNAISQLTRLLLEPKLGSAPADLSKQDEVLSWKTYSWQMRSVWLENIVLHHPKRWLPEKFLNYDELLAAAVEGAVNDPLAPKDLATWQWGAFNAVEIEHPVLGKIPLVRKWSGPGVQPQSGSGYTVKAVSRNHGPSERFTANLADLDQSTLNIVTGQGGNFLSPYYMDQWAAWYGGTTFALPYSPKAVESAKAHRLVLEPSK